MIPEFGHLALILACCFALAQVIVSYAAFTRSSLLLSSAVKPMVYGGGIFLLISFSCLVYAFMNNDFSVVYVAENSNSQLPWIYKMTAIWGAHEGSLLLWVAILGLWSCAVCFFSKTTRPFFLAKVVMILGIVSSGFFLMLLTTSNPFLRWLPNFPADGQDLNPLLQDPGLAIHPPMLYMGYVGFAVTFAFAIAALIEGECDMTWIRQTRPWAIMAWCFLTLGITLGSWWAYRVLGWGGWWFWDPVENASLLPWLVGTAFIHSLIVAEKRNIFKSWTILLAITAFSLSLLGTFLVRSGILTSVHAFAISPARGSFMLRFLLLVVGGSLLLYAKRGARLASQANFSLLSREMLLLSNNVILMTAMATILLGTLYPLILEALNVGKISVGPPYFNTIFIPLMVIFLFLMGLVPFCRWQKTSPKLIIKPLAKIGVVSIAIAFLLPWIWHQKNSGYVALGLLLSSWVVITTWQSLWKHIRNGGKLAEYPWGMLIAHSGVVVCALGIILSSAFSTERDVRMAIGERVQAGPYEFQFQALRDLQGPNYQGVVADFNVTKEGQKVTTLAAEKRFFTVQQTALTFAAIDAGLFRDLYVALGGPLSNHEWSVRIYYKPFIRWIWLGGLIMMMGGLFSMILAYFKNV